MCEDKHRHLDIVSDTFLALVCPFSWNKDMGDFFDVPGRGAAGDQLKVATLASEKNDFAREN